MSIEIIVDVLDSTAHRGATRLVMIALANYADENGFAWPSVDTIAKKANVSKRSALRAIEELEDNGHLFVVRRRNVGNGYVVLTNCTRPRFPDAIKRLCRWTRLEISDMVTLNLREPSKKMLQVLTPDPAAISDAPSTISDTLSTISDTVTLDPSLSVSEPNTPAQAQIETPVSPAAAVPSESESVDVTSTHHHHTDDDHAAFIAELENAPPPKRIKHTPEEIAASTARASERWWAKANYTTPLQLERALKRYGDSAPALRELQGRFEIEFGLAPDWSSKRQVKSWATGLYELWIASGEDLVTVINAGKRLRDSGMTIASPRSLTNTARAIAAERATAHTAPSARAVKEYV